MVAYTFVNAARFSAAMNGRVFIGGDRSVMSGR